MLAFVHSVNKDHLNEVKRVQSESKHCKEDMKEIKGGGRWEIVKTECLEKKEDGEKRSERERIRVNLREKERERLWRKAEREEERG